MTTQQTDVLIFSDYAGNYYTISRGSLERYRRPRDGNYYVIPRGRLEQYRVPDKCRSEVARAADRQDVTGFESAGQTLEVEGDSMGSLTLLGSVPEMEIQDLVHDPSEAPS